MISTEERILLRLIRDSNLKNENVKVIEKKELKTATI
jgi:hypothetical protein